MRARLGCALPRRPLGSPWRFFLRFFSFLPAPFSRLCPENPRRESPPCFAKAVSLGFFTFRARAGLDPFLAPASVVAKRPRALAHWDNHDRLGRALIFGFFFSVCSRSDFLLSFCRCLVCPLILLSFFFSTPPNVARPPPQDCGFSAAKAGPVWPCASLCLGSRAGARLASACVL